MWHCDVAVVYTNTKVRDKTSLSAGPALKIHEYFTVLVLLDLTW